MTCPGSRCREAGYHRAKLQSICHSLRLAETASRTLPKRCVPQIHYRHRVERKRLVEARAFSQTMSRQCGRAQG